MKIIKKRKKSIGQENSCFIVAGIDSEYNSNLKEAKFLIDEAAKAKCDAVRFQSFRADKIFNKYFDYRNYSRKDFIEKIKSQELSKEDHKKLFDYCKKRKIVFFSSVFDEERADWLTDLGVSIFKISSYELTHLPLIKYIAKRKKPILLSTGIASEKEIDQAVTTVYREGNEKVILMHCVSAYPARSSDLNLATILDYKKKFGVPVGFSDHCRGIGASVLAAALGADIVEKHFVLEGKHKEKDDFCLTPKTISRWVSQIKKAEKSFGKLKSKPTEEEKKEMLWRRAIWAKEDILPGQEINRHSLMIVRPSPEKSLSPAEIDNVIGKKSTKHIKPGELITLDKIK